MTESIGINGKLNRNYMVYILRLKVYILDCQFLREF